MYPNLEAEMARVRMTKSMLAKKMGKSRSIITTKMSGKTTIDVREAFAIRDAIGCKDVTIDELFEWKD